MRAARQLLLHPGIPLAEHVDDAGTGEERERDQAEQDDEQQGRVAGAVGPLKQEQPAEADEQTRRANR